MQRLPYLRRKWDEKDAYRLKSDPFYDEKNVRYLEKKMADYKAGTLKFAEHELIED